MSRKCRLRSYKSIGEDGKWAADRIEQLEAENEKLSLYKQLADEYGMVVFADLAELQKQRDELLGALQRIADGQVMTGSFTHADTVLRYQAIAQVAIANAKGATP